MTSQEPLGVTCHYERGQDGKVYIVWGADFPPDKPGRRLCTPEEAKEAQRLGLLPECENGSEKLRYRNISRYGAAPRRVEHV